MLLLNTKIRRKKPDARDEKKPKTIVVHIRHQRNFVQENMAMKLKKEVSKEKTPIANNNVSVRDIKESIDRVIEAYNGKEKNDGLLPTKHFVHEKLNENGKLSHEEKSIGMNNTYQPSIKKNDDTPGKQKLLKNIPLSFAQAASKRVKLRPKSLEKGHDKEVVSRSQLSRQMALELIEKFEKANKEKQNQLEDVGKTGVNRRPESRARNIVELTLQKTESLNTYLDIKDKKSDHIVKESDWNRPQSNSSYRNREKEPTTPGVVRVEEFWGGESPLRSIRKTNVHRKRSSEKLEKTPLNIKSSFELPKNSKEGYEGYDPKGIKIKAQSIMEKSMQCMQDRTITKITIGSPQQRNLRKFLNQVNSHREFIKGEKISISSIPLQKTVLDNPDKKQNPNGPSIDSDRRLKLPDTLKAFSGKTNNRETTKYIRSLTYRGNPSAAGTETPLRTRNYKEFTVAALHKIPKTQFMEAVGRKY